jgi:hypothetical protein
MVKHGCRKNVRISLVLMPLLILIGLLRLGVEGQGRLGAADPTGGKPRLLAQVSNSRPVTSLAVSPEGEPGAGDRGSGVSNRKPKVAAPYDWGVAYYMPYDNNLSPYGRPIIKMIRDGVTSERTIAAVQADFP